jgi:hypothetical protein
MIMNKNTKRRKMDRIVAALLVHGSQEKAAAALNMSPVTIWRWCQKPEFQETYDQARSESYSRAIGRAQYAANRAVSTLVEVMSLKDLPSGSRVRAADSLLDHAGGAYGLDLMRRVEQLEVTNKQSNKRRRG